VYFFFSFFSFFFLVNFLFLTIHCCVCLRGIWVLGLFETSIFLFGLAVRKQKHYEREVGERCVGVALGLRSPLQSPPFKFVPFFCFGLSAADASMLPNSRLSQPCAAWIISSTLSSSSSSSSSSILTILLVLMPFLDHPFWPKCKGKISLYIFLYKDKS
jgi:hypothetical protein